jgi:hypothetical protein|tara:strand:+ start:562 stop:900 length:339 start_codon:yes stop_codon:yes gene_type:complete
MARDFEVSYPVGVAKASAKFNKSYGLAENKLLAFKGYIGSQNPETRFIVYSRGAGRDWPDDDYRERCPKRTVGPHKTWERFVTSLVYASITFMPPQNATLPAICWAFSLGAE